MPFRSGINCLVTGAACFVGSHLVEELLRRGFGVVGVDNFFSGHRENMRSFIDNPHFLFVERSIAEDNLISKIKEMCPALQHLFHLAAIVSVPYSLSHESQE